MRLARICTSLAVALLAVGCSESDETHAATGVASLPSPSASARVLERGVNGSLRRRFLAVHDSGFGCPGSSPQDFLLLERIPGGHVLRLEVSFEHARGDIDVELLEGGPQGAVVAKGDSTTDDERLSVPNRSGTSMDYAVRIYAAGEAFHRNEYEVRWTTEALDRAGDSVELSRLTR